MDKNRKWRCGCYTLPTYHGKTEGRDTHWYVFRFKMNAAEMDPPEERIVSCPTLFEKTFFQWPHERTQISTFSFHWLASNDWPSSFLMLRTCRIYWKSYTLLLCASMTLSRRRASTVCQVTTCLTRNGLEFLWVKPSIFVTNIKCWIFFNFGKDKLLVISSCIFHILCQRPPAART